MNTQAAVRAAFWLAHPEFDHLYRPNRRQNDYPCDVRAAWVNYVDYLYRSKEIDRKLAFSVTL